MRTLPPSEPRERETRAAEVAESLELPGVKQEIAQLARQLRGEVLLDDEFRLKRFVSEVESHPYRVVHIASHGFFGSSTAESFILTYDDRLDMNGLAGLLQPKQLAERPVELLVLSACQTAEGNDRTPLGLSGVALKSGARSALGSLWPVYDEVARQLLPAFYAHLSDPGVTKAQALQQAQLTILRSDKFAHPTFWAAFILVGNWL
jgi:CHAT domain-containing protein